MGVYAGGCGPAAPITQGCNVGYGGFTTTGVILVLFILLVIVSQAGFFL